MAASHLLTTMVLMIVWLYRLERVAAPTTVLHIIQSTSCFINEVVWDNRSLYTLGRASGQNTLINNTQYNTTARPTLSWGTSFNPHGADFD